ncbi:MAG: hypothetical protein ACYDBQ_09100 [Thermoplasmatota archaeon]
MTYAETMGYIVFQGALGSAFVGAGATFATCGNTGSYARGDPHAWSFSHVEQPQQRLRAPGGSARRAAKKYFPDPFSSMRMRLAWLLIAAAFLPVAGATLSVTASGPPVPVPLDGSRLVSAVVTIDCSDIVVRGSHDPVPIVMTARAPGLNLSGPAVLNVPQQDCVTMESGKWTGNVLYHVTGSGFLPGLVPITANVTAALNADPADAADPVPAAHALTTVTPVANVSVRWGAVQAPATANQTGATIRIPYVSASNVPVSVTFAFQPMPAGNVTLPSSMLLPANVAPVAGGIDLSYRPPAGVGVDSFHLLVHATAVADASLHSGADVALSFTYGSAAATSSHAASAPALVALAALGLAVALRRR